MLPQPLQHKGGFGLGGRDGSAESLGEGGINFRQAEAATGLGESATTVAFE
jgi:hypothetical protein